MCSRNGKEDANEIIHAWMDNLDVFLEAGRKEGSLEFGVDIPVWFDRYAGTDPSDASLAEAVMKRFDYTTLMAYRHELEGGMASWPSFARDGYRGSARNEGIGRDQRQADAGRRAYDLRQSGQRP